MAPVLPIIMGLAQFAPHLMRFFGAGETSTAVADKVANVAMAVSGAKTPAEALAAIRANAEMQAQFAQRTLELDHEMERAYLADVANARQRDVAIVQSGRYNWRADLLAFLAVCGLVLCVYFIARDAALPERAVNAIMFVAGVLASAVRDVYGFEFGSSRGSKQKDDSIAEILKR